MNIFKNPPDMVLKAKEAKFKPNGVIQVLIFILIFLITQLVSGIPVGIILFFKIFSDMLKNSSGGSFSFDFNEDTINQYMPDITLISLFFTAITIVGVIIYVRFIEKRSLYSMGFNRKKAVRSYILGYLIGIVMFSVVIIILYLTNNISYEGYAFSAFPMVIPFFIGFLIQGMSEEVMMRGYLMNSLAARHNVIIAILVNSVIFGLLHLFNPGVSFLAILNIVLFGIFASVYAMNFNSIWGVCALHSAWNFVQGNVYGLEVSGLNAKSSIFSFKAVGHELITGGSFGPEGGIAVTFVLIISTALLLVFNFMNNNEHKDENNNIISH